MNETSGTSYDQQKFYIGKICKRGHEYKSTGGSLRNKKYCDCIECVKVRGEKRTALRQAAREKYHIENKDKIKRERNLNPKKRKKITEEMKQLKRALARKDYEENKEKIKKQQRIFQKKCTANLGDNYVKKKILRSTPIKNRNEITDDLIKLKREQLLMNRLIRRLKKWV